MNPSDELVDVVDDAGNTIGTVTRREMREQRLPHRVTYLLVFDRRGHIFVHLRTETKDVYPSFWDVTIGGVLSSGESFDDGIVREGREELGVEIVPARLFPFRFSNAETVIHGMVYRATHDGPFRLQPEEVVRGEFIPVEQVFERSRQMPFCPDGMAVLHSFHTGSYLLSPSLDQPDIP